MCFVVSADKTILGINARAREFFGVTAAPGREIVFSELLAPDSPPVDLSDGISDSLMRQVDVRMKRPWGKPIDAVLFITRVENNGRHLYYIIARDVSRNKEQELDLLRFSNVVHYTVNPIQITDAHGRMIYVNPAFEKVTGYSKEELIGKNPSLISSRKYPREFWARVWASISQGKVWNGEIENRRKDGQPVYTQLLISPIIDGDGKVIGYLGAHRDITEQKALEQQLMHSQKMESIGTLAAGIAHEVGNPLASISSIVQVLVRTLADDAAKEKLGLVQSQVHRITKIIRDLVDFSRPSNYQVRPTDLVKLLTDAVEIVKMGKKAKNVTFVTHVRGPIPILTLVPDQISQVFINVLLNAVDAMAGAKGTITTNFDRDEEFVRVTIIDEGHGILPEHLPKIFEPFFTTKTVGEGTGLGLWVSYGIMKSFRGDIIVDSVPGQGTSFSILLPLVAKEYQNA
jgi:PAS domain S-box-containing protein